MAQHEVHSDTNWRRIDLDKSGIPVERQEFRPRLAVQPEIIAARPPCFARSPVEHGPGKSAAGEPPRDRQAMNVQRFAATRFRPEDHILIVEIHAGAEFTPCPRDHQLIRLCDTARVLRRMSPLLPTAVRHGQSAIARLRGSARGLPQSLRFPRAEFPDQPSDLMIPSVIFLASPNSIMVLSRKNSSFSIPA